MQKPTAFFSQIFQKLLNKELDGAWLWAPILLGFGVAFYFSFSQNFSDKIYIFLALFFAAGFFAFLNRHSLRSLIFLGCAIFLLGSFYANFYEKIVLHQTKITGKIYVDVVGKVADVKKFYNPVNHLEGANLVIEKPVLYKSQFVEKKKVEKKKVKKKKKPKKKKAKKTKKKTKECRLESTEVEINQDAAVEALSKCKKPRKKRVSKKIQTQVQEDSPPVEGSVESNVEESKTESEIIKSAEVLESNLEASLEPASPKAKKPKKKKSPKKISEKTIQKNFINLEGYQEVDRKFLDYSKNYQQVKWLEIKGREVFPNPPQKISVNLVKNFQDISVNDVIAARLMLQPPQAREFPDDFDFALDAKSKKIGAYGFVLGEAHILRKAEISSLDQWFLSLREKIRGKILAVLNGDSAAVALAFLIGDQSQISKNLMSDIRNSGLAHLLSISGFHLALAGAIFFVGSRFLLARSEYLALHFDLKKLAAISAIFATYFYLKIADSPLPAQRAFLMIVLVLIALLLSEKINSRRAIMTAVLLLILLNPYAVFNVGFQLSFSAILVLGTCHDVLPKNPNRNFFSRSLWYFLEIILISILIQIATLPFLMHSFQNVALLGFVANVLAIPLSSFFVMPLGFLALFAMPLGLEKYCLLAMEQGIFLIEKIAVFTTNLNYSHLVSPQLSSAGLLIAIIGLFLICLSKSNLRFVGIVVFASAFLTIFFVKKPDVIFDKNQKFFAIYDENGLTFSKNLRPSKRRDLWMKRFGEKEFKVLENCDEKNCLIEKDKKILVLLARNKISEICQNDFDVIVNLTGKYQLPSCVLEEKIKIDNFDFYQKGAQFLFFKN